MLHISSVRGLLGGALLCLSASVALAQGAPHPPFNDRCGGATPLENGVAVTGDIWAARDDLRGQVGCQDNSITWQPDAWYTLVATGPRLTYTLQPNAAVSNGTFAVLVFDSLSCDSAAGHLIASTCGSATLQADLNVLQAGRTYYVAVSAASNSSLSLPAFQLTVTTGPTGVNGLATDLANRTALVLAPNPARGNVRLTLGEGTRATAAVVTDALGRDVRTVPLSASQRTADISLTDLRPGVYLVRVGTVARRLMVE